MKFYNGDDEGVPIGFAIGPGISFGNMMVAGAANQKFLKELIDFNMINRTIKDGETVYGIIGVRDTGYNPLSVKFKSEI